MMNTIINAVNAIPENFGWAMVGFFTGLLAVMLVALGKTVYLAIKSRLEDDEEDEVAE